MKLSRTVVYAIQATVQLAQMASDEPVPCSQLASRGNMPERFLLQILRLLVTHGILHSTRGVEGGYVLDRKPDEISLLDIIEAIDGPVSSNMPPIEGQTSAYQERLREVLDDIAASAKRRLAEIKLADLMPVAVGATAEVG